MPRLIAPAVPCAGRVLAELTCKVPVDNERVATQAFTAAARQPT